MDGAHRVEPAEVAVVAAASPVHSCCSAMRSEALAPCTLLESERRCKRDRMRLSRWSAENCHKRAAEHAEYPSDFSMFVPSLPWQMIGFNKKAAQKRAPFSHRPRDTGCRIARSQAPSRSVVLCAYTIRISKAGRQAGRQAG